MDRVVKNFKTCSIVTIIGLLTVFPVMSGDLSGINWKCPEQRFIKKAPEPFYSLKNPLKISAAVLDAGEKLYLKTSGQVPCMKCHGEKGNGRGILASMFDPPPRNFWCAKTVDEVPDGQLFWIIKNGTPDTNMPAFDHLSDNQIWQLVHYIRKLSKEANM